MHTGQRAWVVVSGVHTRTDKPSPSHYEVDKPLSAHIEFVNRGATPATFVRMEVFGQVRSTDGTVPEEPEPFDKTAMGGPRDRGTMEPSVPIFSDMKFSPRLSQDFFDAIQADKLHFFVFGKLTYCDVFGFQHWTTFCYHQLSGGAYAICSKNEDNDIDKDPNPPRCRFTK